MSRLRWPDSTNSVSEKPGTIHWRGRLFLTNGSRGILRFLYDRDSRQTLNAEPLSPSRVAGRSIVVYPSQKLGFLRRLSLGPAADLGAVHITPSYQTQHLHLAPFSTG